MKDFFSSVNLTKSENSNVNIRKTKTIQTFNLNSFERKNFLFKNNSISSVPMPHDTTAVGFPL